jgi:hypothetical protein
MANAVGTLPDGLQSFIPDAITSDPRNPVRDVLALGQPRQPDHLDPGWSWIQPVQDPQDGDRVSLAGGVAVRQYHDGLASQRRPVSLVWAVCAVGGRGGNRADLEQGEDTLLALGYNDGSRCFDRLGQPIQRQQPGRITHSPRPAGQP